MRSRVITREIEVYVTWADRLAGKLNFLQDKFQAGEAAWNRLAGKLNFLQDKFQAGEAAGSS